MRVLPFFLVIIAGSSALADDVRQVAIPSKDIVYDPATKRIYASVPGSGGSRANSITVIDPVAGTAGESVFIGSEPGKIVLSDASKYLWVALDGSNAVRRFDISAKAAGIQFSLGPNLYAEDLAPVPGDPDAVIVVRSARGVSPRNNPTAIYRDGKMLPKTVPGGNSIALGTFGSHAYAYTSSISSWDFTIMRIVPDGLEMVGTTGSVIIGNVALRCCENGLVYTDQGKVIDPEARLQIGEFPGFGYGSQLVVDAAAGRAYFLADRALKVFDSHTFGEIGSIPLPAEVRDVYKLIRWGSDGIAIGTRQGKIFLVRSSQVGQRKPPVDLALTRTPLPEVLKAGQPAGYTLTVKNNGSVPATGVSLTDELTKDLDVLDIKASQGSATAVEGVLRADLGTLAPGASVTVNLRVQPAKEGAFSPTAIVRCNEVDLVASNNAASQRTQLAARPAGATSGIDLTGTWTSAGQSIHGAGVDLQATLEGVFVVRNVGTAPAPATKLRFLLSYTFGPFLEEDLLQEVDVPPLAPGKTFEAHLRANLAKGDSAVGDVLTAVVDATKLVADANPENNTVRSKPIP